MKIRIENKVGYTGVYQRKIICGDFERVAIDCNDGNQEFSFDHTLGCLQELVDLGCITDDKVDVIRAWINIATGNNVGIDGYGDDGRPFIWDYAKECRVYRPKGLYVTNWSNYVDNP